MSMIFPNSLLEENHIRRQSSAWKKTKLLMVVNNLSKYINEAFYF